MNRAKWTIAWIAVLGTVGVMWGIAWLSAQFYPQSYPGRMAYAAGEDAAPVDLADIQRGWPANLDDDGERARLVAYLHDTKGTVPVPSDGDRATAAPEQLPDLGSLLAAAREADGAVKARACASCHDFSSGGPDRIGPNLWGIVGRDIAGNPGYAYSDALFGAPGVWSYEMLYDYLASPARSLPGTKMSFAGMRRPEDRAAVIRYLATLGDNAPPFPLPQIAAHEDVLEQDPE